MIRQAIASSTVVVSVTFFALASAEGALPVTFFRQRFTFDDHNGKTHNTKTDKISIKRDKPSDQAKVLIVLCGFDVSYAGTDHHVERFAINIEADGFGPYTNDVPVKVSVLLRDKNGDDNFSGSVDVGVIVIDSDKVHVYNDTKSFAEKQGSGPQAGETFIVANVPNFDRVAFLRGFDIHYGSTDHHVYAIDAAAQGATLPREGAQYDAVTTELGLRDSSNNWDDPYGGDIHFSMLRFPKEEVYLDSGELTVDGNHGPKEKQGRHFSQTKFVKKNLFVGLSGVHLSYIGSDHHVRRMVSSVDISEIVPTIEKTEIKVSYTGTIMDKNGDDSMRCRGQYVVLGAK